MSNLHAEANNMRPEMGQSYLTLPLTFDYNGGRKDSAGMRKVWTVVLILLGLIIGFGIIFNKKGFFLTNLILGIVFMFVISLIIRFGLLKENKLRRNYELLKDSDYQQSTNGIWGIYDISESYPHYCRFRNGKSGLFISLNKDVILGKYSESEFEHYEAISDAYNLVGEGKVMMYHIDYMDNVGTDERIEESFINLSEVSNTDLKDVLLDMFTYQKEQMMERVTTFDTYLFLWSGSDINAWSNIQRILSCLLEANYRSYHILNSTDLRELPKVVFNLHDFSVLDAMANAFTVNNYSGVVPIKVEDSQGNETIINKTLEEKREIREQELIEKEAQKKEKKRRGNKKSKGEYEEEFDIFGNKE